MRNRANATKLKRWREERHWSQEHLAGLSGLGVRTIQRIENGEPASSETLAALAAAYNVDIGAITTDEANELRQVKQKDLAGLLFSFLIHLASFVLCTFVFVAIGISTGDIFTMLVPAAWWFVGLVGHGLAVVIVALVFRYQQRYG